MNYMKVYMIRHAETEGNAKKQYIGSTDEPLSEKGIYCLLAKKKAGIYPKADFVYSSPMLRCRQTCRVLYGDTPFKLIPELSECDFGDFEGKCHEELKDNPNYRIWIESFGKRGMHGGEDADAFRRRCCSAFKNIINEVISEKYENTAVILHGGTIMAILEKFSEKRGDFYSWQVGNGEGYCLTIDPDLWQEKKKIRDIIKF